MNLSAYFLEWSVFIERRFTTAPSFFREFSKKY